MLNSARAAAGLTLRKSNRLRCSPIRIRLHNMSKNATPTRMTSARKLATALEALAISDSDYWSYKRMAQRPGLHGIVRYPAMMVPRMQDDILRAASSVMPDLRRIIDPFVGSGTTLIASLRHGIAFEGIDINPLAILICRAKLLDLSPMTVSLRTAKLIERLAADHSCAVEVEFFGRDKWFTESACTDLSRIRRAIVAEQNKQLRQFFWVVLSETIRQTSLSRETTYKLHIRPNVNPTNIVQPTSKFKELVADACDRYAFHHNAMREPGKSTHPTASLHCRDVRTISEVKGHPAQLLLTSPPYGDNQSTIPYGQFSYLALSWISESDLEGNPAHRKSAYATDSASLGGSSRDYVDRANTMAAVLPSFRAFFEALCLQGRQDLEAKAASFTADFFDAVGASLNRLDKGGVAVWTLGERTIGGIQVPLINICREVNQFFGMSPVSEITRRIQSKRTPHRNSVCATMARESIVVMAKP